jgi:N-acetylneuraminic acid mutarotase
LTKDFIYAVGSRYPDDTAKKAEVYDVSKNLWTEVGDLNVGRHYHSMCVVDQRYLYVIGGRDSMTETPLDSIERLDCFADPSN